jgi:hypothetical protein
MDEMDDRFLESYEREPRASFVTGLRRRLEAVDEAKAPRFTWRPVLVGATALATVIGLFAFPSVRGFAQSMLDMFRVRNFVAVSFDPERIEKLRSLKQDRAFLVFDQQQVVQEPGRPVVQPSVGMASAVVGFNVATPSYLPSGFSADTVTVTGEGRARFGVTTSKLQDVLNALDLRDVVVPAGLDGQRIDVHIYPSVQQRFRGTSSGSRLSLIQSRNPDVMLPSGVDLPRLGEIGLRILGVDAGEARRMAGAIDWRSTLVVPVPLNASSFRQVNVHGNPGLLVEMAERKGPDGGTRRGGVVLLWTEGERVFALQGTVGDRDMVQVAESVH